MYLSKSSLSASESSAPPTMCLSKVLGAAKSHDWTAITPHLFIGLNCKDRHVQVVLCEDQVRVRLPFILNLLLAPEMMIMQAQGPEMHPGYLHGGLDHPGYPGRNKLSPLQANGGVKHFVPLFSALPITACNGTASCAKLAVVRPETNFLRHTV